MKLTVPRDKWERSTGESVLWNGDTDCGCILGHFGLALGYTKAELVRCGHPSEVLTPVNSDRPLWPSWIIEPIEDRYGDVLGYRDSPQVDMIILQNDRAAPDEEQERKLKLIFASRGVELEFV